MVSMLDNVSPRIYGATSTAFPAASRQFIFWTLDFVMDTAGHVASSAIRHEWEISMILRAHSILEKIIQSNIGHLEDLR